MLFDPSALAQYSVVDVYVNGSVYSLYLTVYTNGRRFFNLHIFKAPEAGTAHVQLFSGIKKSGRRGVCTVS